MKKRIKINDLTFELFITQQEIEEQVQKLASQINKDFHGENPIIFITLKGAIFFACDLIRRLDFNCRIETITAKSYGMEMKSSGKIQIQKEHFEISDKHIILIEDIVDSGLTAMTLSEYFKAFNPASFSLATLLSKPTARRYPVDIKYLGFEIPDKFVIGYGLDYAEFGRNLPDIYILANE